MTESEWLACDTPTLLLAHVREMISPRKDRLLAIGACSVVGDLLPDVRGRPYLFVAEAYADGRVSELDLQWAAGKMIAAGTGNSAVVNRVEWTRAEIDAMDAVARCLEPSQSFVAMLTVQRILSAVAHHGTPERNTPELIQLIHDVMGNPFRSAAVDPRWLTSTVVALADAIYADRAFDRLPILADALEDAGCADADILAHCCGPGPHVRGCWVVDAVLGKT
jgi:hypothetical protein